MTDIALGVSEALELINHTLDEAYPFISIEGEVASFKVNQGKFVFFDIKDTNSTLGCFMMVFNLKFPLEDGMKVRIIAQPKVTNWGKFSLTVQEVVPVGEGSLKKSFELLKKKLETEGLFDQTRKRMLPMYPQRIGVVSSSGAAGYTDFIKILDNRWGGISITLADITVQGSTAPEQIVGALNYLNNASEPFDLIAVVRGGGSADDLAAFNHEDVVRAIALSRTPTIVGVGHEIDTSLADLAADVRAATPSNAAELIVPSKNDVLHRIHRTVATAENGVTAALTVFAEDRHAIIDSITKSVDTVLSRQNDRLQFIRQTVSQLDPATVLKRGYALVKKDAHILSSTTDVTIGEEIIVRLKDGEVGAGVTYVNSNK